MSKKRTQVELFTSPVQSIVIVVNFPALLLGFAFRCSSERVARLDLWGGRGARGCRRKARLPTSAATASPTPRRRWVILGGRESDKMASAAGLAPLADSCSSSSSNGAGPAPEDSVSCKVRKAHDGGVGARGRNGRGRGSARRRGLVILEEDLADLLDVLARKEDAEDGRGRVRGSPQVAPQIGGEAGARDDADPASTCRNWRKREREEGGRGEVRVG